MTYELVCGLETHVELSTNTKLFCSCKAEFGGEPNTHCCPICTGMPGTLPSLNRKAVEYTVKVGLALHSAINQRTQMARKNYTYPDLPKAYQISQAKYPIAENGYLELKSGKKIRIERIHLEEDAGKLIHIGGETHVDYNRCGVPLIEIVTRPDFSSEEEVKEYLEQIQILVRYLGVSDSKMQEGSMRSDVNISVKQDGKMGTRTEIKNMGAPSFIQKAMKFEYLRQLQLLSEGKEVEQVTMRYDENDGTTRIIRKKENAQDYRFFPEPDLPTISLSAEEIKKIKDSILELPMEKYKRYLSLGISEQNAKLIYPYKNASAFFDNYPTKVASNLLVGTIYSVFQTEEEKENFEIKVNEKEFEKLVRLVEEGKVQTSRASSILLDMLQTGKEVSSYDLEGISEERLIEVCKSAIGENKKAVSDFVSGKEKAIGALVGYVMKATRGKADSKKAECILRELMKIV